VTLLEKFAEKFRLRMTKDDCGDPIVRGKFGDICEYGDEAGHMLVTVLGGYTSFRWNRARTQLKAAGCQVHQNGETEGSIVFEPANDVQARLAIHHIQAFRKRAVHLSPEQRAAIGVRLQKAREKSLQKAGHSTLETQIPAPVEGEAVRAVADAF